MAKTFQSTLNITPREFYLQDTVTVAKNLLGKKIIRKTGNCKMSGIITETEAYKHKDDPASHAFRKMTDPKQSDVWRGWICICLFYIWNALLFQHSSTKPKNCGRRSSYSCN